MSLQNDFPPDSFCRRKTVEQVWVRGGLFLAQRAGGEIGYTALPFPKLFEIIRLMSIAKGVTTELRTLAYVQHGLAKCLVPTRLPRCYLTLFGAVHRQPAARASEKRRSTLGFVALSHGGGHISNEHGTKAQIIVTYIHARQISSPHEVTVADCIADRSLQE